MSTNIQGIEDFLDQLFIIEPKIKNELQKSFPEFSEEKQKKVLFVLEKSLEKQNEFVEKALKNNPHLMEDIQHEVGKEMKKIRQKKEDTNNQAESEILHDLENSLLSL